MKHSASRKTAVCARRARPSSCRRSRWTHKPESVGLNSNATAPSSLFTTTASSRSGGRVRLRVFMRMDRPAAVGAVPISRSDLLRGTQCDQSILETATLALHQEEAEDAIATVAAKIASGSCRDDLVLVGLGSRAPRALESNRAELVGIHTTWDAVTKLSDGRTHRQRVPMRRQYGSASEPFPWQGLAHVQQQLAGARSHSREPRSALRPAACAGPCPSFARAGLWSASTFASTADRSAARAATRGVRGMNGLRPAGAGPLH